MAIEHPDLGLGAPLFVPGNQPRMLDKALGLTVDALIPDMEDSVPDAGKAAARETIASYLPKLTASGARVIPRVNALNTGLTRADLKAVVGAHIDGICIGKVDDASDVRAVGDILEGLELAAGVEAGSVSLVIWIETARGVLNASEICCACARIEAVAFGAEDFCHDMGIERVSDDLQLALPRQQVCIAARAAGVSALDTPYFGFRDPDGLREEAARAKRLGFKGKFAIHPAQVDVLHEVFSPTAEEIAYARRVLAAFAEAERAGRGSTSLEGQVIDVPVVKRARQVLALAGRTA